MEQAIQTMTQEQSRLQGILEDYQQKLPESDLLSPAISSLKEIQKDFKERFKQAQDAGRNLNIAIMGQVKAGKSSFLNALLFNGKNILPEAATPKTANLTRISYAEKPSLTVEYYSHEEWESIQETAQSGGNDSATKAARELVKLIEEHNIDIPAVLQKQKEVIPAENIDELMGVLNEYTGNNGAYTALVKMTHLHLPLEELQGFDIVDTPGMNDPVISRTIRTQEEMSRSDVVFFLSRCSQFLDVSDMALLSEQLPSKGVKRLILVGAQFDSTILDDGYDRKSLQETEERIFQRLSQRAAKEMETLASRIEERDPEKATLIRSLKTPILVSTYAYNFANFPETQWQQHAGMKHVYDELVALGEDEWDDYVWQSEDWQRIANFTPLQAAYQQARQDKVAIIQAQIDSLLPATRSRLTEFTQQLRDNVSNRITVLTQEDLDTLQTQKSHYLTQIKTITLKIEELLGAIAIEAEKMRNEVSADLRKSQQHYSKVQEQTGTRIEEDSYTVSTSKWWNPFSWGSSETRYTTRTINYQYVSASEAASQVRDFAYECVNSIQDAFDQIISIRQIKATLKKALLDHLPVDSQDFDPTFFRNIIDGEIDQITIPELNLSCDHLVQNITQNFQGEVTGSNIDRLKETLAQTVAEIFNNLVTDYGQKTEVIIHAVENLRDSLGSRLTERLTADLSKVEEEFAHKEQNIALYKALLAEIG